MDTPSSARTRAVAFETDMNDSNAVVDRTTRTCRFEDGGAAAFIRPMRPHDGGRAKRDFTGRTANSHRGTAARPGSRYLCPSVIWLLVRDGCGRAVEFRDLYGEGFGIRL